MSSIETHAEGSSVISPKNTSTEDPWGKIMKAPGELGKKTREYRAKLSDLDRQDYLVWLNAEIERNEGTLETLTDPKEKRKKQRAIDFLLK